MAKEKEDKKDEKDSRQEVWDEYVALYAKENPVKHESKKARGEFDKIPTAFRGIKTVKRQANGKEIVSFA